VPVYEQCNDVGHYVAISDADRHERLRRVRCVGAVGLERRGELVGGALALFHLVGFDEPFGLSVEEARASGTPVVAHARGSMPEIVRDGENGFLVASVEEAVVSVEASSLGQPPEPAQPAGAASTTSRTSRSRAPARQTELSAAP
jgi:glycosyltransferase involved in cell wall biosynthesis